MITYITLILFLAIAIYAKPIINILTNLFLKAAGSTRKISNMASPMYE